MNNTNFYQSKAWQRLRWQVIQESTICALCLKPLNKIAKNKIHIDHIKPRTKYPLLALERDNLQALCVMCHSSAKKRIEHGKAELNKIGLDGWHIQP